MLCDYSFEDDNAATSVERKSISGTQGSGALQSGHEGPGTYEYKTPLGDIENRAGFKCDRTL